MTHQTKIFVAYHKPAFVFQSEIFTPIQVGAAKSKWKSGLLRDDSGDNISLKNPLYCELSGLYWVWRNYLLDHPDIQYIGFCHYRRFLNPLSPPSRGNPFIRLSVAKFKTMFSGWSDACIDGACKQADVLLPASLDLRKSWLCDRKEETVYTQLVRGGRKVELDALLSLLCRRSPETASAVKRVFSSSRFHNCLTFVMRRDLFESFSEWLFDILFEMERHPVLRIRSAFLSSRVPGFLAERLVDVWLEMQHALKLKEVASYLLVDKVRFFTDVVHPVLRYYRHPPAPAKTLCSGQFDGF